MEKKQVTLSKFFVNSGKKTNDEDITNSNKQNNKSTKRKSSGQQSAASTSNKKARTQTDNGSTSISNNDVLNTSIVKVSDNTLQKLHQFSADEETDLKREIRAPRNAPNINDAFSPVKDDVKDDDDDEEIVSTTKSGSSASRLSQFSSIKPKTPIISKKLKYTPLEQQFLDIKSEHEDAVLFVECGYKYRFFREDAEIAAQVLKIYCHMDHNFMTASIPTHRLFVHVRRLVSACYKVGVVKQMETAALKAAGDNKNTPFTRKLSALYTKSTLIGEDVDPLSDIEEGQCDNNHIKPNNYLLCIYDGVGEDSATRNISIVAIDPATGDVVYDNFMDDEMRSGLETRITHINPVELLLPQSISSSTSKLIQEVVALSSTEDDRIRIEKLNDDSFTPVKSQQIISDFLKNESETVLQELLSLPKPVLCCISGLIVYLQDFNLQNILKITGNFNKFSIRSKYMQLSGSTLHNLEIFRNSTDKTDKGCLFWVLNHTVTKYGNRLLRSWLTNPLLDIQEIQNRQFAVENILTKSGQRLEKLKTILTKSPDLEKGLCSVFHKKSSVIEFYTVVKSLDKVNQEIKQLQVDEDLFKSSALLTSIINNLPDLLHDVNKYSQAITEAAARENDKTNLFKNEKDFPEIKKVKAEIEDVLDEIKNHRKELRLLLQQPGLDYISVSGTDFLVEVKNTLLKQVPKDWTTINSTKAVTRFHSPYIVKKTKTLSQLKEKLTATCNTVWLQFLSQFGSNFVRYKKAVNILATLDCLLSLATVATQNEYCRPEFTDEECLTIKDGRHPVISCLLTGEHQYVPNDTNLGKERVMIITGPNMGGKSSYIKQVALLCIMAQIGSYIPADSATLSIIDAIYTRMGAADEIFKGRSTFMVELQEASCIMKEASSKSLVILDELGRGTSTYDGLAIAHATAQYFITKVKCFTLFVTHYPSLGELEATFPCLVGNYHMSFLLQDEVTSTTDDAIDSITFLYQLVRGQAAKSYGLNVAKLASIDSNITKTAQTKSKQLENEIHLMRKTTDFFAKLMNCDDKTEILQILKCT